MSKNSFCLEILNRFILFLMIKIFQFYCQHKNEINHNYQYKYLCTLLVKSISMPNVLSLSSLFIHIFISCLIIFSERAFPFMIFNPLINQMSILQILKKVQKSILSLISEMECFVLLLHNKKLVWRIKLRL